MNILDIDLDTLMKINEFRRIRNEVESMMHEQAKEEIEKMKQPSRF